MHLRRLNTWLAACLACFTLNASTLAAEPILLGLDAEFGHQTSTSAQAVEQGITIAIAEINAAGGLLGGRKLELVTRDNRSIPAIGIDNLRELAALPNLVGVFGAKFSPVLLEWIPVAQELGIPIFAPWSSANPITDHGHKPNWIFRLSLKDAWAAPAMLRFARDKKNASRVGILLPNTGWGRSNNAALAQASSTLGTQIVGARWYNWGDSSLMPQFQELRAAGAQAIVLVANEAEGAIFIKEMAALPAKQRLPIISHWGVTGGKFAEIAGAALDAVDFAVVQTYSFVGDASPAAQRVLAALKAQYNVTAADRVVSPVGVAHAYDLTHLVAKAIQKAGSTDRAMVRAALEQLGPHDGLVRRYAKPFTAERHDALSPDQVFMAHYTADDRLLPINRKAAR